MVYVMGSKGQNICNSDCPTQTEIYKPHPYEQLGRMPFKLACVCMCVCVCTCASLLNKHTYAFMNVRIVTKRPLHL